MYFFRWLSSNESACNVGDPGSIPGLGKSPEEGNGNPLQSSCLGNFMDRGAWRATYGPEGHKESDTTERLTHFLYFSIFNCFIMNTTIIYWPIMCLELSLILLYVSFKLYKNLTKYISLPLLYYYLYSFFRSGNQGSTVT